MGREPRGQTGVCGDQKTGPSIAGEGRFLLEDALDERAFVVKWASWGEIGGSGMKQVVCEERLFLPTAEGRDGNTA